MIVLCSHESRLRMHFELLGCRLPRRGRTLSWESEREGERTAFQLPSDWLVGRGHSLRPRLQCDQSSHVLLSLFAGGLIASSCLQLL